MQLEVRHLRTVCAIAEAGSLTKAAVVLGVSQPSLTAQLRRIEEALGGQVFQRGRRGVSPTPFGQYVLSRAQAVMLTVDDLRGAAPNVRTGPLRLGGVASPVLSGLLERVFEKPGEAITVHTEYSPRLLLDLLTTGRLDAATLIDYPGYELPAPPSVELRVVTHAPICLALKAGHPLAAQEEIRLADLADEKLVLSAPDGAGWPEYFVAACLAAGFTPHVPHLITEGPMVRQLIAGGHAISPCQATFLAGPDIVVRLIAGAPLWLRHLVGWRRDGPFAGRGDELTAFATEAHKSAIAAIPGRATMLARQVA